MTQQIIKSEVVPLQNETYQVRFICLGDKKPLEIPFIRFSSQADIERAYMVKQRNYVLDKLNAWLHQRLRARPDQQGLIINLEYCLSRFEKASLQGIANYVSDKRQDFEKIAPTSEKSRCIKYFNNIITPILDFCAEKRRVN